MPYVVTEPCIKCKYTDCVAVCPADCFYEGETMLVINPTECIDCGLCEPECPTHAIVSASAGDYSEWLQLNEQYSQEWPVLTTKSEASPEAKAHEGESDKLKKYFSPKPAPRD
jgi:ferredoxin